MVVVYHAKPFFIRDFRGNTGAHQTQHGIAPADISANLTDISARAFVILIDVEL